jgi:hypothetical protein
MKNLAYSLIGIVFILFVVSACNKFADLTSLKGDLASLNGKLAVTKSTVKIMEPDSMLLVGAKTSDTFVWSVTPSGYDSLITKNNAGLIFFKKSGNYVVSVSDNGATPITAAITVTDSVYHTPVQYTTTPLTGDQITLVPHLYKSQTSDSTYLYFVAQTKNSYCGISKLNVADSLVNNTYAIGFVNVVQPSPCVIGDSPIAAVINFTQNIPAPLSNGTFPLSVTLNGITYTGSIVITPTNITYNWNYSSGVLIAPKQISR